MTTDYIDWQNEWFVLLLTLIYLLYNLDEYDWLIDRLYFDLALWLVEYIWSLHCYGLIIFDLCTLIGWLYLIFELWLFDQIWSLHCDGLAIFDHCILIGWLYLISALWLVDQIWSLHSDWLIHQSSRSSMIFSSW